MGGREEKGIGRRGKCSNSLSLSFSLLLFLTQYNPYNTQFKFKLQGGDPPLQKETASNPVHRFTFLITNQTTTTQGMIDSLIQYLLEEIAMDGDEGKRLVFLLSCSGSSQKRG